jgi:hypothetical protein
MMLAIQSMRGQFEPKLFFFAIAEHVNSEQSKNIPDPWLCRS